MLDLDPGKSEPGARAGVPRTLQRQKIYKPYNGKRLEGCCDRPPWSSSEGWQELEGPKIRAPARGRKVIINITDYQKQFTQNNYNCSPGLKALLPFSLPELRYITYLWTRTNSSIVYSFIWLEWICGNIFYAEGKIPQTAGISRKLTKNFHTLRKLPLLHASKCQNITGNCRKMPNNRKLQL